MPHTEIEEPREVKPCPECGVEVVAYEWPCGIWDCAYHSHLGRDCPSKHGQKYRYRLAKYHHDESDPDIETYTIYRDGVAMTVEFTYVPLTKAWSISRVVDEDGNAVTLSPSEIIEAIQSRRTGLDETGR